MGARGSVVGWSGGQAGAKQTRTVVGSRRWVVGGIGMVRDWGSVEVVGEDLIGVGGLEKGDWVVCARSHHLIYSQSKRKRKQPKLCKLPLIILLAVYSIFGCIKRTIL